MADETVGEQLSSESTPPPETQASQPSPVEPAEPTPESSSEPVSAAEEAEELQVEEADSGEPGPLSPIQEQAITQGPLVPDEAAYERLKQQANEKAEQQSPS